MTARTYDPAPILALLDGTPDAAAPVTARTIERWRAGTVRPTLATIDETCIALGWHLCEVYPDLYRDGGGAA